MSIYLDLVRFLAALTVVIDHIKMFSPTSFLWHLRPFGHEAVIIFFVLSGFVIAYSVDAKDRDLGSFAISRLSRLYSVLLPCLIITPMITLWGQAINPGVYVGHISDLTSWGDKTGLREILENALFLNQAWFESSVYFGNGPMWSLGYEFWYYAIFGAAFFLRGWPRAIAIALGCLIAGPKILLLMPVWMMGVGVYHINERGISKQLCAKITIASLVAIITYFLLHLDLSLNQLSAAMIGRKNLYTYQYSMYFIADYTLGLMVAIHFIGIAGISNHLRFGALAPFIRSAAGFTFSIYLFHFPLIFFSDAILSHNLSANWRTTTIIIVTIGGSCLLGLFSERKKHLYVKFLKAAHLRWLSASKPASETV